VYPTIKIGTRPSPLAQIQAEEVMRCFPDVHFEVFPIATRGDRDKATPLPQEEGSDFFTDEIEKALLGKDIDIAIHSAKDIEENMPNGLVVAALTESVSNYDCLVSRNDLALDRLPLGAVVGTSSKNRKQSILNYRKDLIIKDIRGNIDERLRQLDQGDFDAVVIADAALIRLGKNERITQIIPFNIIKPHPLQGHLAVQVRKDRQDLRKLFRRIDVR